MDFFDFEAEPQPQGAYQLDNSLDSFDTSFLQDNLFDSLQLESPASLDGLLDTSTRALLNHDDGQIYNKLGEEYPEGFSHLQYDLFNLPLHSGSEEDRAASFSRSISAQSPLLPEFASNDNSLRRTSSDVTLKKSGTKFTKEITHTLKTWLREHASNPYPTDEEKIMLQTSTGLRREQITNWLANARRSSKARQQKMAPSSSNGPSISSSTNPINIAPLGKRSYRDMNPLDRWKLSPPEFDPAPIEAISNAAATFSPPPPHEGSASYDNLGCETGEHVREARGTVSVGSLERAHSNASSSSIGSNHSATSVKSSSSRAYGKKARRRRGWKAVTKTVGERRRFECTFCTDTFKTKYDWQRHEKTLHLSLSRWRCSPDGPVDALTGTCVFCGFINPDDVHLQKHNYLSCAEKPPQERNFYRKDNLRQHLKLFHGECTYFAPTMDGWEEPMPDFPSRCGFCDATLLNWNARADHIAAHFKSGLTLESWTGDHNFPPQIMNLCENNIPPYFIPRERNTFEPFSATNISHTGWAIGYDQASLIDLFDKPSLNHWVPGSQVTSPRLEARLGQFVRNKLAQGLIPSDQEIQVHARLVIFEDPDPFNQTFADHKEWLDGFKRRMGIEHLTTN